MSQLSLDTSRGFTLVELLVSMFVAALVIMAASTTFIVQNKLAAVQSATSDVQISGQMVVDLLERDVRMAGYRVDKSTGLVAQGNAPSSDALRSLGTDAVQVRYSTDVRMDPDDKKWKAYDYYSYVYYVSKDPANPGLMRKKSPTSVDVEPIASNVEDLQISGVYADDGTVADLGNIDSARPVRVTLQVLLKSASRDLNYTAAPPTIGDNTTARPADGYRRRVYSVTVSPRNFGL